MASISTASGRGAIRRRALIGRLVFTGPGLAYLLVFMTIPVLLVIVDSFFTRGRYGGIVYSFTLENFARAFEPVYVQVLWNSILIAGITTLLALLIGYPTAYAITKLPRHWRTVALILVVLPLDELPHPHVCVDRPAQLAGPHQPGA